MPAYQPKTGARCSCRPGIARDNCPSCEGTGWVIDFAAIRRRPLLSTGLPTPAPGRVLGTWTPKPGGGYHFEPDEPDEDTPEERAEVARINSEGELRAGTQ